MPQRRRRIRNFAALVAAAIPEHARGKTLELRWQDEARVGQQGSLTYVWADKGSRPRAPRDQRYAWAYLSGAVCPARGVGAALVLPCADTRAMNLHLAEISTQIAPGAHAVITLDGAGWHRPGGELDVPAKRAEKIGSEAHRQPGVAHDGERPQPTFAHDIDLGERGLTEPSSLPSRSSAS